MSSRGYTRGLQQIFFLPGMDFLEDSKIEEIDPWNQVRHWWVALPPPFEYFKGIEILYYSYRAPARGRGQ